jgi:hypothetical protein
MGDMPVTAIPRGHMTRICDGGTVDDGPIKIVEAFIVGRILLY